MKKLFIITGASGHLGRTIIHYLSQQHVYIRGLILPHENLTSSSHIHYYHGNVLDIASLERLFEDSKQYTTYVIHTAGLIQITEKISSKLYNVNVIGTQNMIKVSLKHSIHKFIYISSVHAIPESSKTIIEVSHFHKDFVKGAYAKTKAEASQLVLDAVAKGLPAVIIHPSGIIGPYGDTSNHLIQLVDDYIHHRIPASIKGGYDFVDVRDVARGCIFACDKGRIGECYILSHQYYEIKELLNMVKDISGGPYILNIPVFIAKLLSPLFEATAKHQNKRPLYTKYSLSTLATKSHFSHQKASDELHYTTRNFKETLSDTIEWLNKIK